MPALEALAGAFLFFFILLLLGHQLLLPPLFTFPSLPKHSIVANTPSMSWSRKETTKIKLRRGREGGYPTHQYPDQEDRLCWKQRLDGRVEAKAGGKLSKSRMGHSREISRTEWGGWAVLQQ